MAVFAQYDWIWALTVIFAFLTAVGIGANDISNSFATSVASGALTLAQIVVLGGIFEFSGAVLLGAGVTSTIKSGVADLSYFKHTPSLLLYGFMCVSLTTAITNNLASQLALPVSGTHAVVGATVGMALVLRGGHAVIWSKHKNKFPFLDGVVPIFLSWFVSPIMAAIICAIIFVFVRIFVLRSQNSFKRAFYMLPFFVGGIFWLIVTFVIQTGSKNGTWKNYSDAFATWVGAVVGFGVGIISLVVVLPLLRRRIDLAEKNAIKLGEEHTDPESLQKAMYDQAHHGPFWRLKQRIPLTIRNSRIVTLLFYNVNVDINKHEDMSKHTAAVHENAEVFDPKTEAMFRYLQVFSACVMSFTHGANDVSNAMGPFSAAYTIWNTGQIGSNVSVETWILAIGGAGIVFGLAFFSHKCIRCLGTTVCKITPARGFAAEISTAITVAVASRYGLPVSTTQTITGALIALGLTEGVKGVNWRACIRIFSGWLISFVFAMGVCAAFVGFGAYSPNRLSVDATVAAAAAYNVTNTGMLRQLSVAGVNSVGALNQTFYQAYSPVEIPLKNVVSTNLGIFSVFNQTFAGPSARG